MAYTPNMRKAVPGYPRWEADENGNVYRDGIEVVGHDHQGYVGVGKGDKRAFLVCSAFHGPKPFPLAEVRHLNDIKSDDRSSNLAWGTHHENMLDASRNGSLIHHNQRRGENHGMAKFTDDQIEAMRNMSRVEIMDVYGVSRSHAYRILKGEARCQ